MEESMKQIIEIKTDVKRNGREIRHLHFLTTKKNKEKNDEDLAEDEEEEEALSDSIPCETYRDLQELDKKFLSDACFFTNAVYKCIIIN